MRDSNGDRFASMAAAFCAWAEAPPGDPVEEAGQARQHLVQLFAAALDLTLSDPADEAMEPTDDARKAMYRRFGALPFNYYSTVDPLVVPGEELLTGDLADDLADTWADVSSGLSLYRAGRGEDAALAWRWRFDVHWGEHAADALAALQKWHSRNGGA